MSNSMTEEQAQMALTGRESPPMANGELVFETPWESRVFGMARLLCESGCYEWDDFRQCLISEIEQWDAGHLHEGGYHYYTLFFNALESLLTKKGICMPADLHLRTIEFSERSHGHDH
jgi:nitrile hydratase accessory protein